MRPVIFLIMLLAASPAVPDEGPRFQSVEVKPGDTLWDIAHKFLKDPTEWPQIVKHNPQLSSDPTVVLPGMRLKVPTGLLNASARSSSAATLSYIEENVEHRPKGREEWRRATLNMSLQAGDQLRTGALSRARIKFPVGAVLNMDSHSLVVITPPGEAGAGPDLQLVKGKLKALHLKMNAVGVDVVPDTKDAVFEMSIENGQVKVDVFRGQAKIKAAGVEVPALAGQFVAVPDGLAPRRPEKIVAADAATEAALAKRRDKPTLPAGGSVVTELGNFDLEANALPMGAAVAGFRMQASATKDFTRVLFDRVFDVGEKVTLKNVPLESGVYWWRVAPVDLLGATGKYTEPRQATLN